MKKTYLYSLRDPGNCVHGWISSLNCILLNNWFPSHNAVPTAFRHCVGYGLPICMETVQDEQNTSIYHSHQIFESKVIQIKDNYQHDGLETPAYFRPSDLRNNCWRNCSSNHELSRKRPNFVVKLKKMIVFSIC